MGSTVPLNRPPLAVAPGPSSVQQARHWVIDAVERLGRSELAETSELGVSELVTNAVLHGEPPITVRLRGTLAHPRVEVRDGSTEPPVLSEDRPLDLSGWASDDEQPLITVGRGLAIVARCADAWGAEIDQDGKVVWFAPASAPRDDARPGTISGLGAAAEPVGSDAVVPFRILGATLRDLTAFGQHYRELSREVRLLALAHQSEYPLAQQLAELFGSMERRMRAGIDGAEVRDAVTAGRDTVDLTIRLTSDDAASMSRFVELLDFADDFCRDELLSLARTPEQRAFQTWFLTEFDRQRRGESPSRWAPDPPPTRPGQA